VRSRILLKMRVQVLYFGVLKESLGREGELVELAEGACVADLMARYGSAEWMRSIAVAVNREYARREDFLREGDEVALLPPVSGGVRRGDSEGFPDEAEALRAKCGGSSTTPRWGFARNDTSLEGQADVARHDTSLVGQADVVRHDTSLEGQE
jgi:molybdopterin converting factor small subunit